MLPLFATNEGPDPQVDPTVGGCQETTKRRIARIDSNLAWDIGSSTIGKGFLKRRNVDFLLGDSNILITIPDEDASNLS